VFVYVYACVFAVFGLQYVLCHHPQPGAARQSPPATKFSCRLPRTRLDTVKYPSINAKSKNGLYLLDM